MYSPPCPAWMTKPFTMATKLPFAKRMAEMRKQINFLQHSLPAIASQVAAKEFEQNFQAQGLRVSEGQVQKWKPRQRADRTAAERNNARRSILVKSGELRGHIRTQPTVGMAHVYTKTPYARIHNRGGRIKGQMRAYATNRKSGKTRLRPSGSPAYMPARPFMVQTPLLRQKINQALHEEVVRVLGTKSR